MNSQGETVRELKLSLEKINEGQQLILRHLERIEARDGR
jgi:hypothetical protein